MINLNTAKARGREAPPTLLIRATRSWNNGVFAAVHESGSVPDADLPFAVTNVRDMKIPIHPSIKNQVLKGITLVVLNSLSDYVVFAGPAQIAVA